MQVSTAGGLLIEDEAQEEALGLPVAASHVALLQALKRPSSESCYAGSNHHHHHSTPSSQSEMLQAFDLRPSSKNYLGTTLANKGTSAIDPAIANPSGFQGINQIRQ